MLISISHIYLNLAGMDNLMDRKIVAISTSPFPYGNNITDGPGYRAWHLLQELAKSYEVTILSLYENYHLKIAQESEISEKNILIKCIKPKPNRIAQIIKNEKPDVLYLPWSSTPFLSGIKQKLPTIIDYVGAGLLEEYATKGYIPITLLEMKLKSFWLGDFFLTAGERERYYLLGLLAASKRMSHGRHNETDPLIHLIPMTPPQEPPAPSKKLMQKKPGEFVLLVAGAFLPWYDYTTFFKALRILDKKAKSNLKVLFMGGNPRDPKFERLVKKMGKLSKMQEKIVYTGTVPFKQRANYYSLADVAINIPANTIEDELSVRTRVVDYIWAGLPILTPAKDEYSTAVVEADAGFAYQAGDASSLAQAIEKIITHPERLEQSRKNMRFLLEGKFNLKNYILPLEKFIRDPYINPSRLTPRGIGPNLFLWVRDVFGLLKR